MFAEADFENPHIVNFQTADQDDEEYQCKWQDFEKLIKEKFDRLKVVYSRADKFEGQLAISSHKLDQTQYDDLIALEADITGRKFTFKVLKDEPLNEFWQKQGGHFHYCIAPKKRVAKKNSKKTEEKKREERKAKMKQSYEIAGALYIDINKVKSKARAILNNVKDAEKIGESDHKFLAELLKFHENQDKGKDLEYFEVNPHP